MKKCPQCNESYSDDSFVFCLNDGATLLDVFNEEKTQVLPYPYPLPSSKPFQASAEKKKSYATYSVILILAILLTGSLVALIYERTKETPIKDDPIQKSANESPELPREANKNPGAIISQNQARYSVSSCGSIKDDSTKLEWFVGPDKNMTWGEAQQWTANLSDCGGGWRMPANEEIRGLYNPSKIAGTGYYTNGKYFPAHIDPIFNGIGGGSWVWTNRSFGNEAQSFNLNQGKAVTYSAINTTFSTRAFAIRSVKN